MRKKLLAGILALALCSTNMPPQTIFAEEFTSGNQDVVSEEETPEIFTNEELEAAGETDEELSVFSSDEVPEFNDAPDEAMAAAENEQAGEIDLADNDKVMNGVYTISSAGDHKFTCSRETGNRIVVDGKGISPKASINIYLNKVNINTSNGPALQINVNVEATVTIYLTGTNNLITKHTWYAGLQKVNTALLIITTNVSDTTAGILNAHGSSDGEGAGIGGGLSGSCSNITIESCSVIASSKYGAGIGGGKQGAGSKITINSASVTASSTDGAGIGGGLYGAGSGSDITINSSSVTASSTNGAGIGGGKGGAGSNNITINGGSVKASSVSGSPTNAQEKVYCCTIENPENANVTIKPGTGSSVWNWKPVNHSSLDPDDTNLYVWLPKLESNSTNSYLIILDPENSSESRTRNYSFDTVTNTFKAAQVVNDFIFKSPVNLIYDGQPKEASLEFKFKPTHENNRKISLVYYKGNYNDINENTQPLQGVPVNAGTYTVKAEIEASKSYFAHKGLVSPKWTFTIEKAPVAPGADPNETTISVPWSCKKISDITNPFSTDWKWDNDVKLDQELQVGKPITATAVYNGNDKGNYEK